MVSEGKLADLGLRRCRCGQVKFVIPDAAREQFRASGEDPAVLDRCLACEQLAAIREARDTGRIFGLDEFRTMLSLAGRNAGPWLLSDAKCFGAVSDVTIVAVTADVWSGAEYPQDWLRQVDWLDLFTVAGFAIDGRPADRPTQPVTLWRGCPPKLRRHMSWTSDRELARKFAFDGLRGRPKGALYQTTAPPEALLCINHISRQESEYVINTRGLTIREVPYEEGALPIGD